MYSISKPVVASMIVIAAGCTVCNPVPAQDKKDDKETVAELRKFGNQVTLGRDGNVKAMVVNRFHARRSLLLAQKLHNLRHLSLEGIKDKHLELVKGQTALENLVIYSFKLTNQGMESIGEMKSIKSLTLFSARRITATGLEHLGKLENLESLLLFTLNATDSTMKHLGQLSKLTELRMVEPKITDEGLKHLSTLSNLKVLDLNAAMRMGGGSSGPDPRRWGNQMTDKGMGHIAKMTNLEMLALTNTRVGPGLKQLKDLDKLKELILDLTDITDDDLKHLSEMKNLGRLNLNDTNISDEGLKHLEQLTNLKNLSLFVTKVTKEGVKNLNKELRRTWIQFSKQP